ncbi:sigma-70 family RNA polymerase sigma factor [Amycolatopsis thermophila]|uniref:RNA polymerase sigma factor (Sigma-70 family) n=1 Tax=Amycolatopsis thermophila TaxID=206084 RepID=A0ABU0ESG1_9PSEU|nr:sigma-70 family RNA polymerase sigma factor [Amycolatopsis thermophila]MDQ0378069.1 RNA polymerase sigma factor (sigma-70 family) [Amycolatopsis thermophila]
MMDDAAVPEQRSASEDEAALLGRLRAGEDAAFRELFELHASAVRRLARGLAADSSEAEDITAETFFRVLQALRRGNGPKEHIRAYLLTVARRVSWEWHGARRDVPVTDDELTHRAGAGADAHARTAEHSLITTAFTSLPERWRTVLWQTEVEGEQPAVVAPNFGLSANATAALARRARQGLRAAYLQAHLAMNRTSDVSCRGVIEKLGGYTAGSVTGAEARRIRGHLLGCASCRAMHAELRDVCSSLRAHAGVVAMLVPASVAVAGGAAGGGTSCGVLTTLKTMLVSKLKIGVVLASTTAAGVVGFAVGPAVVDESQPIGLPAQGGVELRIAEPESQLSSPPSVLIAPDEVTVPYPGAPADEAPVQQHQQAPPPVEPTKPADPPAHRTAEGTSTGSGRSDPVEPTRPSEPSSSGSARDDLPTTDGTTYTTKDKPDSDDKPGKGWGRDKQKPTASEPDHGPGWWWWLQQDRGRGDDRSGQGSSE